MSSLWTPSGEVPVDPEPERRGAPGTATGATGATGEPRGRQATGGPGEAPISAEELAAVRQVHQQIRATPAVDVVANHGVQLFELALVYLGVATPPDEQGRVPYPDLAQAGVAVDAMAALVDGMGNRLGEHEATLREALSEIQMLYVQVAEQLEPQGR